MEELPDEILLKILTYLTKNVKDLLSVQVTSKRMCKLATDNVIWGGWGCSIEIKDIDQVKGKNLTKAGVIEALRLSKVKPKLAGSLFSNIVPYLKKLDVGEACLLYTSPSPRD